MDNTEIRNNKVLPWMLLILAVLFTAVRTANNVLVVTDSENSILNYLPLIYLGVSALFLILSVVTGIINKVHDPLTLRVDSVERAFSVLCIVTTVVPYLIRRALISSKDMTDFYEAHYISIAFLMTIVTMYVIGFPSLALSARKTPAMKIEQKALGLPKFLMYVSIVAGLCMVGAFIGAPVHMALTIPFNSDANSTITEMMLNSSLFERILTVGVLAPIFEELMFRKILIDRTIKYGEFISIALSGLMFGLFHGNFQQFFFATLAGALFAHVYIRTGRIRYTIFLHMAVNLSTSVVTASILSKLYPIIQDNPDLADNMDTFTALIIMGFMGWVLLLLLIAVTGIVLLCVFYKRYIKIYRAPGEPSKSALIGQAVKSPVFWSFIVLTLSDFLSEYLPGIAGFIVNR